MILKYFYKAKHLLLKKISGNSAHFSILTHQLTPFALLLFTTMAWAQESEITIKPFSASDELYIENQYRAANSLVYKYMHTYLREDKAFDLKLLQKLLDAHSIKANQRRELQSLGVVLGQFLAKEHRLKWVIYTDYWGRSRGLQVDDSRQVIFPMTMISRRVEANADVDVMAIYQRAEEIIHHTRDNAPLFIR